MLWVWAIVLIALLEYLVFGMLVGRARGLYKIMAPAVTGHPQFERYFRVHQNTLENLVAFIPAVIVFGMRVSTLWAAILGGVFVVARLIYAVGYLRDPKQREIGAGLSFLTTAILVVGALYGVIRELLHSGG